MSPIIEEIPDCKGAHLPYQPGFSYAAINSDDASHEANMLVFATGPDLLRDFSHVLDVSTRKVKN